MNVGQDRSFYVVVWLMIVFAVVVSAIGLFYTNGGQPFIVVNSFGDTVKLYGDGLYAYDTYFNAPIYRGSDLTILFLAVPFLIGTLVMDMRRRSLASGLLLFSVISIFTYHAVSISFCVVYNWLHLAYIILFSLSIFAFIMGLGRIDKVQLATVMSGPGSKPYPYRGLNVFLAFTGVALIAAWLPDIIVSWSTRRPPVGLEIYTTSVTNVLDIGLIGPASLLSIFLIRGRNGLGYALAAALLTLCTYIGIMVVSQTIFQVAAGIELPLPVLITKAGSFVVLAAFAVFFAWKIFRNVAASQG